MIIHGQADLKVRTITPKTNFLINGVLCGVRDNQDGTKILYTISVDSPTTEIQLKSYDLNGTNITPKEVKKIDGLDFSNANIIIPFMQSTSIVSDNEFNSTKILLKQENYFDQYIDLNLYPSTDKITITKSNGKLANSYNNVARNYNYYFTSTFSNVGFKAIEETSNFLEFDLANRKFHFKAYNQNNDIITSVVDYTINDSTYFNNIDWVSERIIFSFIESPTIGWWCALYAKRGTQVILIRISFNNVNKVATIKNEILLNNETASDVDNTKDIQYFYSDSTNNYKFFVRTYSNSYLISLDTMDTTYETIDNNNGDHISISDQLYVNRFFEKSLNSTYNTVLWLK